jgi:hypothetical protein
MINFDKELEIIQCSIDFNEMIRVDKLKQEIKVKKDIVSRMDKIIKKFEC